MTIVGSPQRLDPTPIRTESPEERARREREQRIDAAAPQVRIALGDLLSNLEDVETYADGSNVAAGNVAASLSGLESAHEGLSGEVRRRPMDAFQQDEVCFALDEVAFARDEVQFSVDTYEFDSDSYASAVADHTAYLAKLEAATAELGAAAGPDPAWATLLEAANTAAVESEDRLEAADVIAGEAADIVSRTVRDADEQMRESRRLAGTVADC